MRGFCLMSCILCPTMLSDFKAALFLFSFLHQSQPQIPIYLFSTTPYLQIKIEEGVIGINKKIKKKFVMQGPGQCNQEYRIDTNINMNNGGSSSKCNNSSRLASMRAPTNHVTQERAVNRRESPEKRQRVPSAYNQFIKEEIQRIKANNPDISHREAFSTAAKNWAHFPHIHFGLMLESNNQANKMDNASEKHLMSRAAPALLNK